MLVNLSLFRKKRTLSDRLMDVLDNNRHALGDDAGKVEDMIVEVALLELGDGAAAWAEARVVSTDARQKVLDFKPKPRIVCTSTHCERRQECASPNECTGNAKTLNLCDCELSHNGCGMSGRECDCPAGAKPA